MTYSSSSENIYADHVQSVTIEHGQISLMTYHYQKTFSQISLPGVLKLPKVGEPCIITDHHYLGTKSDQSIATALAQKHGLSGGDVLIYASEHSLIILRESPPSIELHAPSVHIQADTQHIETLEVQGTLEVEGLSLQESSGQWKDFDQLINRYNLHTHVITGIGTTLPPTSPWSFSEESS